MAQSPLRTFRLENLTADRRARTEKIVEFFAPAGLEQADKLLDAPRTLIDATLGSSAFDAIDKALDTPLHLLTRPRRISEAFGDTILVRSAGRYDLIEVLAKAQIEIGNQDLQLVKPPTTFTEANLMFSWQGTLIEFYFGEGVGDMVPHYVAWHPNVKLDVSKKRSLSGFRVRDIARK